MRLIGNNTHGDLAEIAIAEFINQYMYDFRSIHVGKDLYRAKSQEEDIKVINEITKAEFPVSLKAYGDGPLQLSTDKSSLMFSRLEQEKEQIKGAKRVAAILADPIFTDFSDINVLPLIYDEKRQRCNILVFDYARARSAVAEIQKQTAGNGRIHPVYRPSLMQRVLTSARFETEELRQMHYSEDCGHTQRTLSRTLTASRAAGSTIHTTQC